MDAALVGLGGTSPSVDFYVPPAATGQHIVPILVGQAESDQQAQVLCQLVLGAVPQVPDAGNDWPTFLSGPAPQLGQIDAEIRSTLKRGGRSDYAPDYDVTNDRMTVNAVRQPGLGG
jgi:hypothetical protein